MKNINLIAFGTFGSPNGFTQTFFLGNPIKGIKAFDLRGIIKLLPNSEVYSIRKEYTEGFKLLSYSKYTFALEPTSSRGGSFIGSSIIYIDKIPEEIVSINNLKEFHHNLINKNVNNEIIKVKHSNEFDVSECKPKDFDKIIYNLKDVENLNFNQGKNKDLVVLSRISDNVLQQNLKKSLILLNNYDTIYFTDNIEIAELTKSKGIYKTIDETGFDLEINNIIEERKRKREQSISEFEREVQSISEARKQSIQEFENQLDQNKRTHLENERKLNESKNDINKIGQFYDDFLNKTKNLIHQLKQNNGKLDEVKQTHNSNKILFNNSISDFKKPTYTTSISKPKPKGNLKVEQSIHHSNIQHDQKKNNPNVEITKYKIDFFKLATLTLSVLLISTWIYIFIANDNEFDDEQSQNIPKSHQFIEPNSRLSEKDCKIVSTKINYEYKLDKIVDIIFKLNPKDIQSTYEKFRAKYSILLYNKNENCFEIINNDTIFKKDSLKNIPSHK